MNLAIGGVKAANRLLTLKILFFNAAFIVRHVPKVFLVP
jgi:hypothetical protein